MELKSLRDRLFTAPMPVVPRRVSALSTHERTLVISQPRYWAPPPPLPPLGYSRWEIKPTCAELAVVHSARAQKPTLTFVSGSPTCPASEF